MIVKLEEQTIPVYVEQWNGSKNWYEVGYGNSWFKDLQDLYYKSAIHGTILNNLHLKIKGKSKDKLFNKVALDYIVYGGFALEILWNLEHTKIIKANYMDYSKVRSGKPDDQNRVQFYYYSNDWLKYSYKEIDMLQAYNPNPNFDDHQIYTFKRDMLGEDIYPKPYYVGGLDEIVTNIRLKNYYSTLIKNNFIANTLISINSYFDEEKQAAFEKDIKKSIGTDSAGSVFVLYSEDKEHAPTIERFNNDADDTRYQYITEQNVSDIAIAHNLPVQLLGVLVPGKLGNATDIPVFDAIYNRDMVIPIRDEIIEGLKPIYEKMLNTIDIPVFE